MDKLLIFNSILIVIIIAILVLLKKLCKSERSKNIVLVVIPIITILCHYSTFIFYSFTGNDASGYLGNNPNLLLPIYPCNVVMWLSLVLGLLKNKSSKFGNFLIDYIFWFGIISTLVGMFANVDFIRNPTLKDFEVTKSVLAHATLLLNSLILPVFGYVNVKLEKNILHIAISIVAMFIIGCYCNLLFEAIVSTDYAYEVNSMFIIHSPFEALSFLKYPLISVIAFVAYFITFAICELFAYKKGERWHNRLFERIKNKGDATIKNN